MTKAPDPTSRPDDFPIQRAENEGMPVQTGSAPLPAAGHRAGLRPDRTPNRPAKFHKRTS